MKMRSQEVEEHGDNWVKLKGEIKGERRRHNIGLDLQYHLEGKPLVKGNRTDYGLTHYKKWMMGSTNKLTQL